MGYIQEEALLKLKGCGKILSLDWGAVYVGLALSDFYWMSARPYAIIKAKPLENFFLKVENIIRSERVIAFVIGVPFKDDGSTGWAMERVVAFSEALYERIGLPIYPFDERYSSANASSKKGRNDDKAAQVILERALSYLLSIS